MSEDGKTLLMHVCDSMLDNPLLALGLLERGANVHSRCHSNDDPSLGNWNALMFASRKGNLATCTVYLNAGAELNSGNVVSSALSLAAGVSAADLPTCPSATLLARQFTTPRMNYMAALVMYMAAAAFD